MDDGMLIEQVSTFPQLYAKTDGRYRNQRLKENAWLTISQILEKTPEACEHRWKLLRNKYTGLRREIKNKPSGSAASQITWPYFKMMGFLDKYLQTRRSYSNIGAKPENMEWNSMSQIIVEHEQENETPPLTSLHSENEDPENDNITVNSQSDCVSSLEESSSSKSVIELPKKKTCTIKKPILRRLSQNENIPRQTMAIKKLKTAEVLSEKIGGCFETFSKVLEKNMSEPQPTPINEDEHFVRSLTADLSIFSKKDKIILKKKFIK